MTATEIHLIKRGQCPLQAFRDDVSEEEEVVHMSLQEVCQEGIIAALGVQDEVLRVHGVAPGTKAEGVARLIYENLDGLINSIGGNEKLEKAEGIIDNLEADLECYNAHKLNLMHKDNKNGFSQLFKGSKVEVRSVSAHNSHEGKVVGRYQEGGTAALVFGQLVKQYDFEASGQDESGLARWVVLVFLGDTVLSRGLSAATAPARARERLLGHPINRHDGTISRRRGISPVLG